MNVNIHDAKTNLSKLLTQVEDGEEIIICRAGKPVAKITAAQKPSPKLIFGLMKGDIWMADDFDTPIQWMTDGPAA